MQEKAIGGVPGRQGYKIMSSDGTKAAIVVLNSDETWVLKAFAPNAEALLNAAGAKLKLPAK